MDKFDKFAKSFRDDADSNSSAGNAGDKAPKRIRRYLEGWETRTVIDEKGRVKNVGVYVGNYYTPEEPKKRYIIRKAVYLVALAAAGAAFIYLASRRIPANSEPFIAVCQTAALCALGWMFVAAVGYAIGPYEMTEYDYRSGSRTVIKSGLVATIGLAVSAAGYAVYAVLHTDEAVTMIPYILVPAALAVGVWFLRKWERGLGYSVRSAKKPVDSAYDFTRDKQ